MSPYAVAVFLHLVGALALAAGLGLEWAGLQNLRRATSIGQAREWAKLLRNIRRVGGPAALLLLASGVYLGAANWGHQPWIALGLVGLVAMAVSGALVSGPRLRLIGQGLAGPDGLVSPELAKRIHHPALTVSIWGRTGLALGIVFIMSVKPALAGSLGAVGLALVAGVGVGLTSALGSRREEPTSIAPQA